MAAQDCDRVLSRRARHGPRPWTKDEVQDFWKLLGAHKKDFTQIAARLKVSCIVSSFDDTHVQRGGAGGCMLAALGAAVFWTARHRWSGRFVCTVT
jgi:hypothetical protein